MTSTDIYHAQVENAPHQGDVLSSDQADRKLFKNFKTHIHTIQTEYHLGPQFANTVEFDLAQGRRSTKGNILRTLLDHDHVLTPPTDGAWKTIERDVGAAIKRAKELRTAWDTAPPQTRGKKPDSAKVVGAKIVARFIRSRYKENQFEFVDRGEGRDYMYHAPKGLKFGKNQDSSPKNLLHKELQGKGTTNSIEQLAHHWARQTIEDKQGGKDDAVIPTTVQGMYQVLRPFNAVKAGGDATKRSPVGAYHHVIGPVDGKVLQMVNEHAREVVKTLGSHGDYRGWLKWWNDTYKPRTHFIDQDGKQRQIAEVRSAWSVQLHKVVHNFAPKGGPVRAKYQSPLRPPLRPSHSPQKRGRSLSPIRGKKGHKRSRSMSPLSVRNLPVVPQLHPSHITSISGVLPASINPNPDSQAGIGQKRRKTKLGKGQKTLTSFAGFDLTQASDSEVDDEKDPPHASSAISPQSAASFSMGSAQSFAGSASSAGFIRARSSVIARRHGRRLRPTVYGSARVVGRQKRTSANEAPFGEFGVKKKVLTIKKKKRRVYFAGTFDRDRVTSAVSSFGLTKCSGRKYTPENLVEAIRVKLEKKGKAIAT